MCLNDYLKQKPKQVELLVGSTHEIVLGLRSCVPAQFSIYLLQRYRAGSQIETEAELRRDYQGVHQDKECHKGELLISLGSMFQIPLKER